MRRLLYSPFKISTYARAASARFSPATFQPLRPMATENSPKQDATETSNPDTTQASPLTKTPLPLPEPTEATNAATLDVNSGLGVKLPHLGPMVVNRDGTLSRIANWDQMSDIERRNTMRILGKRNQLRMDALKSEEEDGKD